MIDFGQIGDLVSKFFDTDYCDIKRDFDGFLQEVYSNVPCHISYSSVDNPDPNTVDIKPVIQSLSVHFPLWVDVKNNDFLIGKKMSNGGNVLAVYSGRCGNPIVSQGRQKVAVNMSATNSEEPTPVPPKNPFEITVQFYNGNDEIEIPMISQVEQGASFTMPAPEISGFVPADVLVDGVSQGATAVLIENVRENHTVRFLYAVSDIPTSFRFLVNGLFTRNDGSLANGYHLYRPLRIGDFSILENDTYRVVCENVDIEHEDNGKILSVVVGAKLVLEPNEKFVKVSSIENISDGNITFLAQEFVPTDNELNAYVCNWYG